MINFLIMMFGAGLTVLALMRFIAGLRLTWPMFFMAIVGFSLFIVYKEKFEENGRFKPWLVIPKKTEKLKSIRKLSEAALYGGTSVRKIAIRKLGEYHRDKCQGVLKKIAQRDKDENNRILAAKYVNDNSVMKEQIIAAKNAHEGSIDCYKTEEEFLDVALRAKEIKLRLEAVRRINRPDYLKSIVFQCGDSDVCIAAVKKLPNNSSEIDLIVEKAKARLVRLEAIKKTNNQKLLKDILYHEADREMKICAVKNISDFNTLKRFPLTKENNYMKPAIAESMCRAAKDAKEFLEVNVDVLDKKDLETYLLKILSLAKDNAAILSIMKPFADKAIINSHTDIDEKVPGTHRDSGYNDCHADTYKTVHNDNIKLLSYENKFPDLKYRFKEWNEEELKTFARFSVDWQQRLDAIEKLNDEKLMTEIVIADDNEICRKKAYEKVSDEEHLCLIAKKCTDPQLRKMAMLKIDKENVYNQVALTDESSDNRMEAIAHIVDETVLKNVVKSDGCMQVRLDALSKISDENYLIKTVLSETLPVEVSLEALKRIDAESIKEKLLLSKHDKVREQAVALYDYGEGIITRIVESDKSVDVRLRALSRIENEDTVAQIAASIKQPDEVSLAAVEMLKTEKGLRTVAKSFKPVIRRAVVNKTDDEELLKEFTDSEQDCDIILMAMDKISDQKFLASLIDNKNNLHISLKVLEKIADEYIPPQALLQCKHLEVRRIAAERIVDEDALNKAALHDENESIRYTALQRVNSQDVFAAAALANESERIKVYAINRLTSKETLEKIINNRQENPQMKRVAMKRICSAEVNGKKIHKI